MTKISYLRMYTKKKKQLACFILVFDTKYTYVYIRAGIPGR